MKKYQLAYLHKQTGQHYMIHVIYDDRELAEILRAYLEKKLREGGITPDQAVAVIIEMNEVVQ